VINIAALDLFRMRILSMDSLLFLPNSIILFLLVILWNNNVLKQHWTSDLIHGCLVTVPVNPVMSAHRITLHFTNRNKHEIEKEFKETSGSIYLSTSPALKYYWCFVAWGEHEFLIHIKRTDGLASMPLTYLRVSSNFLLK
jgi:hypothetical protein